MQDTQVGRRIANLLDSLGDVMAAFERAEIGRFLRAAEYGLALDTLSWLLVEEHKPIAEATVREIDSLADVMNLRDEGFVLALHSARGGQNP